MGTPPRCLPHGILGNVAKHYGIWVPPCGQTEGQTHVKTLPSRRTTYAGGNNNRFKIKFGAAYLCRIWLLLDSQTARLVSLVRSLIVSSQFLADQSQHLFPVRSCKSLTSIKIVLIFITLIIRVIKTPKVLTKTTRTTLWFTSWIFDFATFSSGGGIWS